MAEKQVKKEKVVNTGSGWHKFKSAAGATFSKLSKAFLLPIALLPIAGVFLGVGATIATQTADSDGLKWLWFIGQTMNKMGDVAFGNLPVLFAISVAIAYTEDSGVAAITAVVGFLVLNGIQAGLITENWDWVKNDDGAILGGISDFRSGYKWVSDEGIEGWQSMTSYSALWWHAIPTGLITSNVGITSLNTGVFASIFVGFISAYMYKRFHKTQLPQFISFFSGSKLVPIITFFAVIPLSIIFLFIWPAIGLGLEWFGTNSGKLPVGLDSLVYEIIERSLVPFGLHHVFYAPLWWSSAGGSILDTLAKADQKMILENGLPVSEVLAHLQTLPDKSQLIGDQYMMYFVLGSNNVISGSDRWVTFIDLENMGLSLGRFQSGKFGFMLLGLPAAGIAMWLNVPKENRRNVMGIYFSAAFTCFLTGITEPLEFTFLFLAPWLFYGVHMPLASISFMLTGFLNVHVSMTVSGGFIDYVVFGLVPLGSGLQTNWYWVPLIGAIMAPCYFFGFFFAVKYGNVKVPGREDGAVELYTKADVKARKGGNKATSTKVEDQIAKATKIIEYLGGESNITAVDSCASRLRLTVVDGTKVNKEGIMSLGGSTGTIIKGTSVHVVYGGEQEVIKPHMREILAQQRSQKK